MPLLCISLLALLLLPLSLSGGSKRPPSDHWLFMKTHLYNANENTTISLQNLNESCTRRKQPNVKNCMPDGDFVRTLCNLTHKMENLNLTGKVPLLVDNVQVSLGCPDNPDKKPKRTKSVRRRLCSAKAFLLAMTNCYQMLNTISAESTDGHPTPN